MMIIILYGMMMLMMMMDEVMPRACFVVQVFAIGDDGSRGARINLACLEVEREREEVLGMVKDRL